MAGKLLIVYPQPLAYDFSINGGLDFKVAVISSDNIVDEINKETVVTVRARETSLRKGEESRRLSFPAWWLRWIS